MRICLDASPAVHRRAGLGRYVQELTAALADRDEGDEYVAFYNRPAEAHLDAPFDRLRALTVDLRDKPWRLRVLLAQMAHASQARRFPGIDLFHGTDNLLPRLPGLKTVFTLYDLVFRFYPGTVSRPNRWFLTLMMPCFLRTADRIIAISECSKADAVRLYGIDSERIEVIHMGVNARFRPTGQGEIDAVRRRYGLPEQFVLFVGTIEPRKNLVNLLEALAGLKQEGRGAKLVVVGRKGWLSADFDARLHALQLESDVLFPGFVPDEDLPVMYSAAAAFAFPSWYEGFGIPILEAMACGTPVVCSNTSSLPEVAGDAALMVAPGDVRALKEALGRALSDPELRGRLVARGFARAALFTWEKTAEQTAAVYRAVAAH